MRHRSEPGMCTWDGAVEGATCLYMSGAVPDGVYRGVYTGMYTCYRMFTPLLLLSELRTDLLTPLLLLLHRLHRYYTAFTSFTPLPH